MLYHINGVNPLDGKPPTLNFSQKDQIYPQQYPAIIIPPISDPKKESTNCPEISKCFGDNKKVLLYVLLSIFSVIGVAFGIYVGVMFAGVGKYKNSDYQCGIITNITNVSFSQSSSNIHSWNWEFTSTPKIGYFEQQCPTLNRDLNIYSKDNQLVMKTEGNFDSYGDKSIVGLYNCHGDMEYRLEGKIFSEGTSIFIDVKLYDTNDVEIFSINNYRGIFPVNIIGNNNTVLALIDKFSNKNVLTWKLNIYDDKINVAPIIATIAKMTLNRKIDGKDNVSDACNAFVINSLIITCVFIFLVLCGGIFFIMYLCCCN